MTGVPESLATFILTFKDAGEERRQSAEREIRAIVGDGVEVHVRPRGAERRVAPEGWSNRGQVETVEVVGSGHQVRHTDLQIRKTFDDLTSVDICWEGTG